MVTEETNLDTQWTTERAPAEPTSTSRKRGFGSMDPSDEARAAGRKGGIATRANRRQKVRVGEARRRTLPVGSRRAGLATIDPSDGRSRCVEWSARANKPQRV